MIYGHRKRYDRAEREFIEAKTDLHNKSEAKDLLTEHLYTVIHQNEVRKAKKLAELTHKLELESADDEATVDAAETVPLPLCLVMPMNQLTSSHASTSPLSTTTTHTHAEQSATSKDDASDTGNRPAAEPQQVNSDVGCETAVTSPPQTAESTETVTPTDNNGSVPSTGTDAVIT